MATTNRQQTTRLPYHHSNKAVPYDIPLPPGWRLAAVKVPDALAHQQAVDDPRYVRIGQVGLSPYAPQLILYAVAPESFTGVVKTPYGRTQIRRVQ